MAPGISVTRGMAIGILCFLLMIPVVAGAQTTAPSTPKPNSIIQKRLSPVEPVSDPELQARLQSVFSHIEELKGIKVSVQDGVVTLSGKTLTAKAGELAKELASRFEGVVYVNDKTEYETQVETRLSPAVSRVQQILNRVVALLPILGVALLIIVIFWLLSRLVLLWQAPFRLLGANMLLRNLIRQLLRTGIILVGVILALHILDLTALVGAVVGAAGVAGLAIGFAFRDIVENYLAGLLLSLRSPFSVRDLVMIDKNEGMVIRLTSRDLVLMTLDGNHLRIPNATVFKSVIYNYTRNPQRRFDLTVGVGAVEDLGLVEKVGCHALLGMEGVLSDPAPFMRVEELGNFSTEVRFFGWIDQRTADWFKVKSKAIRIVKVALDKAGVEIPEPSQTVHLHQLPAAEIAVATKPKPTTERSAEEEAGSIDTSVDKHLEEHIQNEEASSNEENLLPE